VGRKISDFMSTQNRLGHFGDVSQANLLANWCGKNKPDTTKACIRQSKEMYYNTKYTEKQLMAGSVAFCDTRTENGAGLGLFSEADK